MKIYNLQKIKPMIKKILFISCALSTIISSAQIELLDTNENTLPSQIILYGTALELSETKFHIKNNNLTTDSIDVKVTEISNPMSSALQVCFGVNFYSANPNITTAQNFGSAEIASGSTYNDLKLAPFSFAWGLADSATWIVTAYNKLNPLDSSSVTIVWKVPTICGDINTNGSIDGLEIAGDINLNGTIDTGEVAGDLNCNGIIDTGFVYLKTTGLGINEILGDINGNGIIDNGEILGDANGNGVIDNGETTSISNRLKLFELNVYPNPTSNQLILDTELKISEISIIDITGKMIITKNLNLNIVNVANLPNGIYFIKIITDEKTITKKFVKH